MRIHVQGFISKGVVMKRARVRWHDRYNTGNAKNITRAGEGLQSTNNIQRADKRGNPIT